MWKILSENSILLEFMKDWATAACCCCFTNRFCDQRLIRLSSHREMDQKSLTTASGRCLSKEQQNLVSTRVISLVGLPTSLQLFLKTFLKEMSMVLCLIEFGCYGCYVENCCVQITILLAKEVTRGRILVIIISLILLFPIYKIFSKYLLQKIGK